MRGIVEASFIRSLISGTFYSKQKIFSRDNRKQGLFQEIDDEAATQTSRTIGLRAADVLPRKATIESCRDVNCVGRKPSVAFRDNCHGQKTKRRYLERQRHT